MAELNETHDPGLRSWVESANRPGSDFPLGRSILCNAMYADPSFATNPYTVTFSPFFTTSGVQPNRLSIPKLPHSSIQLAVFPFASVMSA